MKVRLGEYDFESTEETRALDFSIVEISIHPDFDMATYENDIAVIKMHRPTIFDSYIWPVCLPPVGRSFENESAIVTGWGTRYYGGPASTVLMEVGVPVWPRDRCTQSFVQRIPNTVICAGSYEGGGDSCQVKKYRLSVQKITRVSPRVFLSTRLFSSFSFYCTGWFGWAIIAPTWKR